MEANKKPEFWSLESRPKDYKYDKCHMKPAGQLPGRDKNRRYLLFIAPDGLGWYETQYRSGSGWITQEEAVFGRRVERIGKRKRPA